MPWYFYNNRGILKQAGLPDALPVGLMSASVSIDNPTLSVPTGWLLCDGSVQTSATYPDLAAILAYPAAPGATFNVPNLNTRIPIGVDGTYTVGSTGGLAQHPHSINNHTHINDHAHTTATHQHNADHKHDSDGSSHTHGNGSFKLNPETGGERHAFDTDGGDTTTAKGVGSGDSHDHGVTGSTGQPSSALLSYVSTIDSSSSGGNASGNQSTSLGATTPSITGAVDTLPPYLNVYVIIKAVDLSGTYV